MPRITDEQWREAIARVIAGTSDTRTESKRLGTTIRTVQRKVEDAKEALGKEENRPKPATNGPSPMSPEVVAPHEEEDPAYKAAMDAAGVAKPGSGALPTAADVAAAGSKQGDFCVKVISDIKGAGMTTLATTRYNLKSDDPKVLELSRLRLTTDAAVRANAEKLYPHLVRLMEGWGPLAAWLLLDLNLSHAELKAHAVQKGTWKAAAKKEEEKK